MLMQSDVCSQLLMMGLSFVGTSLAMKWLMASIDPNRDTKQKVPYTTHHLQQQTAHM